MRLLKIAGVLALLAITGCAGTGGRCVGEFEYQKARTMPPAPGVEGVKQPESASALRIPPEAKQAVPYAEYIPDPEKPERQIVRCLDTPPVMPAEPAPTPPPQEVPAAPPAPSS